MKDHSRAFALLVCTASLSAQAWTAVDGPFVYHNDVVYDHARERMVTLGSSQDLWESDGLSWWPAPIHGPDHLDWETQLFYDRARRRTNFLTPRWNGVAWAFEHLQYDGVSLSTVLSPTPPPRGRASFAFDIARNEVVMFGGIDPVSGLVLSETWVFNGSVWTQRFPNLGTAARSDALMAYDSLRQRVVLYGGNGQNYPLTDTSEWNGVTWLWISFTSLPGVSLGRGMTYDPVRNRCVMPTATGDVFEYDGTWTQVTPVGTPPPPRSGFSCLFDPPRGEVSIVGGISLAGDPLFDQWSWDGSRWQQANSLPIKPRLRTRASLATEPGNTGVVMFGGGTTSGDFGDTWRWSGDTWTDLQVAGPQARSSAAMFRHQNSLFVFGGVSGLYTTYTTRNDTWSWSGGSWSQLSPAASPSPRYSSAVVYDAVQNEAILFGGQTYGTYYADTWSFDGSNWQLLSPAQSPPARSEHAMAYDDSRSRTVLFGGNQNLSQAYVDTWEWDGSNWTMAAPANPPPNWMRGAGFAYDPLRGALVLVQADMWGRAGAWAYNGIGWSWLGVPGMPVRPYPCIATAPDGRGVVVFGESTLLQLSPIGAIADSYGGGCGIDPPLIAATTWPTPGSAFGVDTNENDPNSVVAFLGAASAAFVPVLGCTQLVAPGQAIILTSANQGGHAHVDMPLPNSYVFVGTELFFQAASLRASAPNGFVMSAGLRVRLGD